jgi:hypothetical protein
MGGFAGYAPQSRNCSRSDGQAKLICTCDPQAAAFAKEQRDWRLAHRGVRRVPRVRGHARCLPPRPRRRRGADAHQSARRDARHRHRARPARLPRKTPHPRPCRARANDRAPMVAPAGLRWSGFNFIIEPPRLALKQRMLAGEFGACAAPLSALWPRPTTYFRRNNWAGRLMSTTAWSSTRASATPWRTSCTTCSSGRRRRGVQLGPARRGARRALPRPPSRARTPSSSRPTPPRASPCVSRYPTPAPAERHSRTHLRARVIRYVVGSHVEIRWGDGRIERTPSNPSTRSTENHPSTSATCAERLPRPATTLVDARPFVALNDLAHISSGASRPSRPRLVTASATRRSRRTISRSRAWESRPRKFPSPRHLARRQRLGTRIRRCDDPGRPAALS